MSSTRGTNMTFVILCMVFTTVSAKVMFTQDPVIPFKSVVNDLPHGEPVLVFVYRSTCPRSQSTMPRLQRAAEILGQWGVKTYSLEYNETGWEYMEVAFPLKKFPAFVVYTPSGQKIRYEEKDPVKAKVEEIVQFAWVHRK